MSWSFWDALDFIPIVGEVARLGQGVVLGIQGKWNEAGEAFTSMSMDLAGDALGLVTGGSGKAGVVAGRVGVKATTIAGKEGVAFAEHTAVGAIEQESMKTLSKGEMRVAEAAAREARVAERKAEQEAFKVEHGQWRADLEKRAEQSWQTRQRERLDAPDIPGAVMSLAALLPSAQPETIPLTDSTLPVLQRDGATKHKHKHKDAVLVQPGADLARLVTKPAVERVAPVDSGVDLGQVLLATAAVGVGVYVISNFWGAE